MKMAMRKHWREVAAVFGLVVLAFGVAVYILNSQGFRFPLVEATPKHVFVELQNAQAIVLPYDGVNPLPPQYCYLKPRYLDVQTSYFDHLERGAI